MRSLVAASLPLLAGALGASLLLSPWENVQASWAALVWGPMLLAVVGTAVLAALAARGRRIPTLAFVVLPALPWIGGIARLQVSASRVEALRGLASISFGWGSSLVKRGFGEALRLPTAAAIGTSVLLVAVVLAMPLMRPGQRLQTAIVAGWLAVVAAIRGVELARSSDILVGDHRPTAASMAWAVPAHATGQWLLVAVTVVALTGLLVATVRARRRGGMAVPGLLLAIAVAGSVAVAGTVSVAHVGRRIERLASEEARPWRHMTESFEPAALFRPDSGGYEAAFDTLVVGRRSAAVDPPAYRSGRGAFTAPIAGPGRADRLDSLFRAILQRTRRQLEREDSPHVGTPTRVRVAIDGRASADDLVAVLEAARRARVTDLVLLGRTHSAPAERALPALREALPLVVGFTLATGAVHVALESSLAPGQAAADPALWHGTAGGPGRPELEARTGADPDRAMTALADPDERVYLQIAPGARVEGVLRSIDELVPDRYRHARPVLLTGSLPDDPARRIEPPQGILRILREAVHSGRRHAAER